MGKVIPSKIEKPKTQARHPSSLALFGNIVYDKDNNSFILKTSVGELNSRYLIDNPMRNSKTSVAQSMINSINDMVDASYNYATTVGVKTQSVRKKIENRFPLPKELFEAVDFSEMGIVEEDKNSIPTFVIGEKYSLKGVSCEGFEMSEKVYELVAIHDEFDGININSLIVKQISGDQDKIFTLSKNDCEHIGIEYENGLQLFPKHLNWKRVKDIVPFKSSDLGTTPVSDIDNTIRNIVIKINGFKDYSDGYIVTPSGKLIKEEQFEKSLRITSNEPIIYTKPNERGEILAIQEEIPLNTEIVYPKGLQYNHGNFISSEDTIYVRIKLGRVITNTNLPKAIDGVYGVAREFLDGFNPNDHFTISWDELGAYTIEEYEAEKARKEKLRQERIAREEAEKKRRIAEEEKRIKEQRKRVEDAVVRMKSSKITIPTFPKMPQFNMDNGISSLDLYMDGLDLYFEGLNKSFNKLTSDLDEMSKNIGIEIHNEMHDILKQIKL